MDQFLQAVIDSVNHKSLLELVAVCFSVMYVLFASMGKIWCWPSALISTSLFTYIMYEASLYLETVLYVYYVVMAVYGWYEWIWGGNNDQGVAVSSYNLHRIGFIVGISTGVSVITGYIFANYTDNSMPYLDAFTTIFALVTTWMVAKKILENWLFWIVIDAASVVLFLNRELYFTTGLYIFYTLIAIFGYLQWRRLLYQQKSLIKEQTEL